MALVLRTRRSRRAPEISMAPMIDMVFILLIFFLVTSTFVRETGVSVDRPQAASAADLSSGPILVALTASGGIFAERRQLDLATLRGYLEGVLPGHPTRMVLLTADRDAPAGLVVDVMDECRLAGAQEIALAADQER